MKIKFPALPRSFDWSLYFIPILLATSGIATIYTITFFTGRNYLAFNQIIFAVIGLVLMIVFSFFDYRRLKDFSWPLYFIGFVLLLVVLITGKQIYGSARWLEFGFFQLQPSEIFKIILIIIVARFFAEKEIITWREILKFLLIISIPIVMVLRQPNFGNALMLFIICAILFFYSSAPKIYKWALVGITLIASPIFWFFLRIYQKQRILNFFNPALDPHGAGYNVLQSKVAVGAGGIIGKGLGQGSQSILHFLPIAHTDFIYAGWAEATGFIGSFILLLLLAILIWRTFNISFLARDRFGQFIAIGIGTFWLFQILINISMNLGIMPVTGLPLPFVSYGGTALVTAFLSAGILQSIYIRHKKISFD